MSVLHLQYEDELHDRIGKLDALIDSHQLQDFVVYVHERTESGDVTHEDVLRELQMQLTTAINAGSDIKYTQDRMVVLNAIIERNHVMAELLRFRESQEISSKGHVI